MANIIEIDRINNVIVMGTTGTTTRFPFLTANRMAYLNGESDITSVSDLTTWVGGTANQITSSDDGDGTITLSTPQDIHTGASPQFTGIELGHASDTTITRVSAGVIAVEGTNVMMVGAAPTAHTHDTDTLQLDAINSDGGAFSFTTTGAVTFNQSIASANYAATNKLTTCATNAGTLDFSAASKTLTVEDTAVVSQDYSSDASPTFANTSLGTGELTTGSINRASGTLTLEIGGTAELSITSTATTFGGNLIIPDGGTIGQAAGPLLTFDDSNDYLEITGCKVAIGATAAHAMLDVVDNTTVYSMMLDSTGGRGAALAFQKSGVTIGSVGVSGLIKGSTEENILLFAETGYQVEFATNGITVPKMMISDGGGVFIGEQAAADTDVAAYGQIWIKSDAPNTLWFTDDAGTDRRLSGGGITLAYFTALDNEPPAANAAAADTRNAIPVLDFDADTTEWAEFGSFMPRNYAGSGVTVTIGWMATDTTVTPHNVFWAAAFKSVSDDADDLDTKAYAANNSAADQEASASGEVSYCEIAFTNGADMDSVAAGEYFRLRIERTADSGSDTLTGDAELVFVEVRET